MELCGGDENILKVIYGEAIFGIFIKRFWIVPEWSNCVILKIYLW